MIRVLMVCMGNICRSPMAEAVFADMVSKAGLKHAITVDSAGTGRWHVGEPAHHGTLHVLSRNHIPYDGRARQLERADLDRFDYVLAMDHENLSFIQRLRNGADAHADIRLFLTWANQTGMVREQEVPDPYYDGSFDRVYNLVHRGSRALLDHLITQHGLAEPQPPSS
jgi:protein-tyrosine phosphatase